MQAMYDSDNFVVIHMPGGVNGDKLGFELVDKRVNKVLYLNGDWAIAFQRQVQAWQENTPHQEEVEEVLDRYTSLAYQPLVMH